MNEKKKCDMCGEYKHTVKSQPSRSQLTFGGFPVKRENRCGRCETKLGKQLDKILSNYEEKLCL